METLDGNVVAGLLHEAFGEEMTAVLSTCGTCGVVAALAEAVVYPRLPGTVIRCRHCASLLMVITRIHDMYCVDARGIAARPRPRETLSALTMRAGLRRRKLSVPATGAQP